MGCLTLPLFKLCLSPSPFVTPDNYSQPYTPHGIPYAAYLGPYTTPKPSALEAQNPKP